MPKAETYIQFIIEELQKDNIEPTKVCAVFCSKFHKSERTFYNYWDIAEKKHSEAQQVINNKADDVNLGEKIEAQKTALKQRNERLEVLRKKFEEISKVKRGKSILSYPDGSKETVKVTLQDELKAIETLAKLDDRISKAEGTDAPTKVANTDSEGKDKPSQTIELPNGASIELS